MGMKRVGSVWDWVLGAYLIVASTAIVTLILLNQRPVAFECSRCSGMGKTMASVYATCTDRPYLGEVVVDCEDCFGAGVVRYLGD